jgi:hypothetical protein
MSHDDGRQIMEKLFGARICQDKDFDFSLLIAVVYIYWTANRHSFLTLTGS